jgi:hypothetical protein
MNDIDRRTLPKSIETIRQISETKREQSREEILENAKEFTLEESDKQLAIPSHRKKKQITLEEYQSLLKQGKTVLEIIKTTSKHLIYFYNVLLKGEIKLSKEEFEEMYNNGISLDEISKTKNIPRDHMTFLREFYGIKRKGSKYQIRLANEKPISQEAKDIIIGSLLGDGHIGSGGYFSEKHSEKQVEYVEWKGKVLKSIMARKGYNHYECIDKRSGTKIYSFSIRTIAHNFLYEMRNKFYKQENGKWIKIIPDNIEELFNERVFAVWFMDDGHMSWGYRHGIKQYANTRPQCKISTQSFSKEDVEKLQLVLKNKWQLDTHITFRKPETMEQPVLKFKSDATAKLIKILKPFATGDLLYKFDEKAYVNHQGNTLDKELIINNFEIKHKIQDYKNYKNG